MTASHDTMNIFDRMLLRRRRDRAAAGIEEHAFLYEEVASRLADRLLDVNRNFALALDLGCHGGSMTEAMRATGRVPGTVLQADLSPRMAVAAAATTGQPAFAADEEFLPVAEGSLDLITSCLSLHWVNDLPGALLQIRKSLKADGFFLGALLGGDTLFELRRCLQDAEAELHGALSPRLSPLTDVRDAGGLLQRAGFALPVVDSDTIEVSYENAFRLMADLRGMGESNAVAERRRTNPGKQLFLRAAELYQQRFAEPDGRLLATFQVLYLSGWSPHESQQQPLRRGSASQRLADALSTEEQPLKH